MNGLSQWARSHKPQAAAIAAAIVVAIVVAIAVASGAFATSGQQPEQQESRTVDVTLSVTADHGCDPSYTKTTDHTREYVPYLICGKGVKPGVDLGTKLCFGTIAQTICDYLGVDASTLDGQSVLSDILK